jgi:hypothetical protein
MGRESPGLRHFQQMLIIAIFNAQTLHCYLTSYTGATKPCLKDLRYFSLFKVKPTFPEDNRGSLVYSLLIIFYSLLFILY